MKNQLLYDAFDIVFPAAPTAMPNGNVALTVEGVGVTMNRAGLAMYQNEHAKGDAFRKALILGVNALSYEGDAGREPLPYASISYSKDRAVTVSFESDHDSLLAYLQGARAVSLCVTAPIPDSMLRNDLNWDDTSLLTYSEFQKDNS